MKNLIYTTVLALFVLSQVNASNSECPIQETIIEGKITDAETGEPLLFCDVALYRNGVLVTGAQTDFDGIYIIRNVDAGTYDVEASYVGYQAKRIHDVIISAAKTTRLDMVMEQGVYLDEMTIIEYKKPLIEMDNTTSGGTLTAEEIRNLPTKDLHGLAACTAGVSSGKKSKRGRRRAKAGYHLDGVPVSSSNITNKNPQLAHKLTATEVNDFADWNFWSDIQVTDFMKTSLIWKMNPQQRYSIQVKNEAGFAVPNVVVELISTDEVVLWRAISDNLGRAELFANFIDGQEEGEGASIRVSSENQLLVEVEAALFSQNIQQITIDRPCAENEVIELAFMMDISGSMSDEMAYLRSEMSSIVERVSAHFPEKKLRVGVVYFQGHGDANTISYTSLTDNLDALEAFIHGRASGGGADEAIDLALLTAVDNFDWSPGSTRIAFLMGDEELDNVEVNRARQRQYTKKCAEKGIKLVPIGCSGMPKSLEYVFRAMAIATGGTYLALTDDSGVGGTHVRPTTNKIDVQSLNQLIFDVILRYSTFVTCDGTQLADAEKNIIGPDHSLNKAATQEKWEKDVLIYPNPTFGKFKIKANRQKELEEAFVCDLAGRIVKQLSISDTNRQFDISEFATGTYFLLLKNKKGQFTSTRIVKVGDSDSKIVSTR